jgi:SAM-dependent methyltransferase
MTNEYTSSNQKLWDGWATSHVDSEFYDVPGFKAGRTSLSEIDLTEMPDVKGKSLLHLQCHFGMDTLSWARMGAEVTGIDFSTNAIEAARKLADDLKIPARFIQSDVLALPDALEGQFDIVYTSYGVIFWLPELATWGKVINHFLKPGGTFYMIEYHPFLHVFEDRKDAPGVDLTYDYYPHPDKPLRFEVAGSYAGAPVTHKVEYGWNHSIGEVINALADTGLHIEFLHEWDYINFKMFRDMDEFAHHKYRLKDAPPLPYMFSLKATKP